MTDTPCIPRSARHTEPSAATGQTMPLALSTRCSATSSPTPSAQDPRGHRSGPAPHPGLRERVQAAIDKAMRKIFPQSDAAPAEPAPAKNEIPQDDDMNPTIQHEAPADDWRSQWQGRTRGGCEVMLVEEGILDWALQGVIRVRGGTLQVCSWKSTGRFMANEHWSDLLPVTPPAPSPEVSAEDVKRADEAYRAKQNEGRNRETCIAAALAADRAAREGR